MIRRYSVRVNMAFRCVKKILRNKEFASVERIQCQDVVCDGRNAASTDCSCTDTVRKPKCASIRIYSLPE